MMAILRLQNSCKYFFQSDHLLIWSSTLQKKFKISNIPKDIVASLIGMLEKGIPEANIKQYQAKMTNVEIRAKINTLIAALKSENFIITTNGPIKLLPTNTVYDRQIRFLDSFETQKKTGNDYNKALQNNTIVIVGLGAYGSWLALHCVRLGLKKIIGIDHDFIEKSNLHRQFVYQSFDLGKSKAKTCEKYLNYFDPSTNFIGIHKKITHESQLLEYLSSANLIFNAFGYLPKEKAKGTIQSIINKAAILSRTPMLCLSANWLGPLYIPGKSACYSCAINSPGLKELIELNYKNNERIDKRAFCPILSATISFAILEVTKYLGGYASTKMQKGIVTFNYFDYEKTNFVPVAPNSNCDQCAVVHAVGEHIHE